MLFASASLEVSQFTLKCVISPYNAIHHVHVVHVLL